MSMIDEMTPASGNVIGADGKVYNLVTLMGGGEPVSDTVYDVGSFQPRSALILGEDGKVYDLVKLIQSGGGGGDMSEYVKKKDIAMVITAEPSTVVEGDDPYDLSEEVQKLQDSMENLADTRVGYSEVVHNQLLMYSDNTKEHLLATLDLPSGGVTDVQLNGTSILADGVANIPKAGISRLGLVMINRSYGIDIDNAQLYVVQPQNSYLDTHPASTSMALTVSKMDYAVKIAMCDGKGPAWTPEEQAGAQRRIGILSSEEVLF